MTFANQICHNFMKDSDFTDEISKILGKQAKINEIEDEGYINILVSQEDSSRNSKRQPQETAGSKTLTS